MLSAAGLSVEVIAVLCPEPWSHGAGWLSNISQPLLSGLVQKRFWGIRGHDLQIESGCLIKLEVHGPADSFCPQGHAISALAAEQDAGDQEVDCAEDGVSAQIFEVKLAVEAADREGHACGGRLETAQDHCPLTAHVPSAKDAH